MPTDTFYKLPEEKQNRIVMAAFEEMCRVPFDELSINKIIQKAGIPRGSFYQYFDNKDDLLAFMMGDFQKQLFQTIKSTLIEQNGDLFQSFLEILKKMIEIGENKDSCQILRNVSAGIKANCFQKAENFYRKGEEFFQEIYTCTDKSKLHIENQEDFREITCLLAMLMWNAGVELFLDISKKEEIIKKAEKRINMIKYGVYKEV